MEIEVMKHSNLYKELETIPHNFFDFFHQVCGKKDFSETVALIFDIVTFCNAKKFMENFWTIEILDFYCFDTNDDLVRMVNSIEYEKGTNFLGKLDLKYKNLALFKNIVNYASPELEELNNSLQIIRLKKYSIYSKMNIHIITYWIAIDNNVSNMHCIFDRNLSSSDNSICIENLNYKSIFMNTIFYNIYFHYSAKNGEEYGEKIFADIVTIYNNVCNADYSISIEILRQPMPRMPRTISRPRGKKHQKMDFDE